MKRIISSILAIVMVLGTCMVPLAEDIADATIPRIKSEILTADSSTKVTITGYASAGSNVSIQVIKDQKTETDPDAFEYTDQVKANATTGAYKFEFKTFNTTAQTFTVKVYIGDAGIKTTEFDYAPATQVISAYNTLLAAYATNDDEEIADTFNETKGKLGLNTPLLTLMTSLNSDILTSLKETISKGFTASELTLFQDVFNQKIAIEAVNTFGKENLKKLFDIDESVCVEEYFGLSEGTARLLAIDTDKSIARFTRYGAMTDSVKDYVINYIIANRPYDETNNLVFDAMNEGIFVAEIRDIDPFTEASEVVENNSDFVTRFSAFAAAAEDSGKLFTMETYIANNKHSVSDVTSANAVINGAIDKANENGSSTSTPKPTQPPSGGGNPGGGGIVIVGTATPPPAQFTDLDSVPWAVEAIESLAKAGVINGVEADKFYPNDNVTREQFAKMAVLAFGFNKANAVADFADVPQNSWSYMYVASASEAGIIQGMGDGTFGASLNITRQDVATICYRAGVSKNASFAGIEDAGLNFSDKDSISDYAAKAVSVLASVGAINGMGDGSFGPANTCTRAQAAKIIYEVSKLMK